MPNITIYLDAEVFSKFMALESEHQKEVRNKLTKIVRKEVYKEEIKNGV